MAEATERNGSTTNVARGICKLCLYGGDCTLARDHGRPVIQCAQFEPFPPRPEKNVPVANGPRRRVDAAEDDTGEYLGLCKTCVNRKDCTFRKGEGGVWHCDEYA